ncbi:DUF624 domain-containing protein [Clostridium sp. YIM B02515]|uniref:DUF624 domain-containing protein n=1 Tax=Clostridium rhizosphaerae TaxID=2803861 RepID=A0ABS1T9J8_9CLOT|nr:DUF624 domain-containing protein [Clostridium rhizosphaerae]MBL4935995.1 DUF624 domain-containing protein [Clostridium rhizosphaerae]
MKGLLNLDGPVYKFCILVYETFMLNLLWFLGSLPIVTIGVSTSALYYVYGKKIRGNSYNIYSDFIKGYKEVFKQSLPIGSVITMILSLSIYNIFQLHKLGSEYIWLESFQWFIVLQILLIGVFIFPLTARFNMTLLDLIKTSVILAYKHLFISVAVVAILIALILFTAFKPSFALFLVGFYTLISTYLIEKTLKKFIN